MQRMRQQFSRFTKARLEQRTRKSRRAAERLCKLIPIWERYALRAQAATPRFVREARHRRNTPDAVAVITPEEMQGYRALGEDVEHRYAQRLTCVGESLADHPPSTGNNMLQQDGGGGGDDDTYNGLERINALERALDFLDANGWARSEQQIVFHTKFINACLRKFMGNDFYQFAHVLRARYDLDDTRTLTLVLTARRFGKTIAVAMFCAACLYTQTNITIAIFSTGRASGMLRETIVMMYKQLCGGDGAGEILVDNVEKFKVRAPHGAINALNSYPENTKIDFDFSPLT